MAVIIDGTTGVATPGVTDTGDLSVAGTTTLTTPLPVASGGTGATSLSGLAVGNLAGGSAGTIPYQSTVGVTAMLATGTSGQALVSAGPSAAPAWGTPSTATNLAGGSAGTIPYQTASGTTAMLAAGTSGQALISNGASAPSWGSAGALTLISTQTASASASISWTGLSGYNKYLLIVDNFVPSTSADSLTLVLGTGAGPTYITTDYYGSAMYNASNSSPASGSAQAAAASIDLNIGTTTEPTASLGGWSGELTFINMDASPAADARILWSGIFPPGVTIFRQMCGGATAYNNTTAKTAIKLAFSTRTIASGKASLYGISS